MHRKDKGEGAVLGGVMENADKKLFELDVSEIRDWAYAMSNLIEAECHLQQTWEATKEEKYAEIVSTLRKLRGKLFEDFIANKDYGVWCASKHLLSCFMQLSEVAMKELDKGNKETAFKYLKSSQDVLRTFILLHEMKKVKKPSKR